MARTFNSEKWKLFLMALVGFLASVISTQTGGVNWWYVLITTGAFVLLYIPKNIWLPSDSDPGTLSFKDIISGLFIAISMAISSGIGMIITNSGVNWRELGLAVIGAVLGYFIKTVPQQKAAK